MKHSLKDRKIQGVQALLSALTDVWDDLTFEDVPAVFLDWMERLSRAINNNGECDINEQTGSGIALIGIEKEGCSQDFLPTRCEWMWYL
jgi:hypothetical protein